MGTRHLIAVYLDGQPKIAQYGQGDGYPDGQGREVRDFLDTANREIFTQSVRNCEWLSDEVLDQIDKIPDWATTYPQLSRDTGSDVLQMVTKAGGLPLVNSIEFAADSLFCEWAYVIDLDAGTFEVYEGFQTGDLDAEGRFSSFNNPNSEYRPVKLIQKWSLDELPDEDTFLAAFQEDEDA